MNVLRGNVVASALVIAIFGSVQATDLPYELPPPEGDRCHFDAGLPEEYEDLDRNTKLSLYGENSVGDVICYVFEIWAGPADLLPAEDAFWEAAARVPRAEVYTWQQCRFSNVMTQSKIDEYAVGYANTDGDVRFVGICGTIAHDDEGEDVFVPKGYDTRIWVVDTD